MAKRSRESIQKRLREKARQDKKAAKREKRETEPAEEETQTSREDEDALMQEFAALSARYETNQISSDRYDEERHRIFVELGIEEED